LHDFTSSGLVSCRPTCGFEWNRVPSGTGPARVGNPD
jgi:hypothetical protein